MNLNEVTLIGRVGAIYPSKNPDICNISVATSESWKDKNTGEWNKETEWHKILCFKHNAEKARNLSKGELVLVKGQIKTNKWTGKDGVEKESKEIRAFTVKSMMSKKEKEELQQSAGSNPVKQDSYVEDDIPF